MLRIPVQERKNWQEVANEYGFLFHTMHGERYWDESAYYQFSLQQIEDDIEAPTEEIHQMCLHAVGQVVADDQWMRRFRIPEAHWDFVRQSWLKKDPSLYSRLDFAYNGSSPAKLYENNADTPTSLYETGFWQWLWLEQMANAGRVSRESDQFNSLQDKLISQFHHLLSQRENPNEILHFACCKGTDEDRGTVQYLEDCAAEVGINTAFVYVEDIGRDAQGRFTDSQNQVITWIFKLYPWEFMFDEEYGDLLGEHPVSFIEPPWKSILSNKALMPMLWQLFPEHPNLLPAFFEDEIALMDANKTWVKKPIYSREGANITIRKGQQSLVSSDGPYGEEGFIFQEAHMLPKFGNNYTLIGSWLVNDKAAGISVREDTGPITQDMSRYLPHIILG
ncbi:MAG: glutathionylspermidine synthase family protein [Neptunomonas phycophila]|uniref:glutathionylspermidine synthase family protein n=1 Tax=Neptunomonas phycophila TaxID=1572645 RepID=UPI003B8E6D85